MGWGRVSTALCFSDSGEMGGLGVLYFGRIDWDSVVDDWNGMSVMSWGSMMVGWGSGVVNGCDGNGVVGSSVSSEVSGFSVLYFGCVDWNSVVDLNG